MRRSSSSSVVAMMFYLHIPCKKRTNLHGIGIGNSHAIVPQRGRERTPRSRPARGHGVAGAKAGRAVGHTAAACPTLLSAPAACGEKNAVNVLYAMSP